MKYKVEVVADSSGKWCSNGREFDTEDEANTYGEDLSNRWILVQKWRVVEVEDAATA